ncbi:MAG: hypothetical protein HYT87_03290 [Nitrospirae bacterium]|nr:hypothetical protein [Nitrospirota bacterium]
MVLLWAVLAMACSSENTGEKPPTLAPPTRGYQIRADPIRVDAGEESEVCQHAATVAGPGEAVRRIEVAAGPGLHHFILFTWESESAPTPSRWPCVAAGIGGDLSHILDFRPLSGFPPQPYSEILFPEDVGFPLRPNQAFVLDGHFLNLGATQQRESSLTVNLHTVSQSEVSHLARILYDINLSFRVPASSRGYAEGTWEAKEDIHLFALTSHTHRRGIEVTIHHAERLPGDPASFEEKEPLYRSRDWSSPAFAVFTEPILIRAGDGLRYRCLFDNDKMIPLIFGVTSEDEMCILYGFYY